MHYLKSFVMTLSLFVLTIPVIQAGDVEDINSMVKKKVAVIFDLLGKKDIEKNERNEKIVGELNEIMDFKLAAYLSLGKHWKKISKTQKKEFVETFQQYINNYIVEKIDLFYVHPGPTPGRKHWHWVSTLRVKEFPQHHKEKINHSRHHHTSPDMLYPIHP